MLLVLLVILLAGGTPAHCQTAYAAEATAAQPGTLPQGYELVAQNDRLSLYLRRDIMALIIENNSTGARLYSAVQNPDEMKDNKTWKGFYQSGVVIEYIEGVNPSPIQADLVNTKNAIDYTFNADGFSALVSFPDIGISMQINVSLDAQGINVYIPQSSITETMGNEGTSETPESSAATGTESLAQDASGEQAASSDPEDPSAQDKTDKQVSSSKEKKSTYHLGTVSVFPFLGHSYLGQNEGYMIIPDGQGAAITLQNNEKRYNSAYDRPVYGDNIGASTNSYFKWYVEPERILMPIFGMVHSDDQMAFLGVIEEGDASARIMAYPNGVVTLFDWIGAKFIYREIYNQPTVNSRQQSAASSSVNMLTDQMRNFDILLHFFVECGEDANYTGLAAVYSNYLDEKGTFLNANMSKAFDMNIEFMGTDQKNDLFGKSDIIMTSFADAKEILDDLAAQGLQNLTVSYYGWQKDGATGGLPVTSYAPAGILGGEDGLNSLLAHCESLGMDLSLSADFLTLNLEAHPLMSYDVFKKITGETWEKPTYKKVYAYLNYLQPQKTLEYAKSTVSQLANKGFKTITMTGFPGLVSDYKENKQYRDSAEMMSLYAQLCSDTNKDLSLRLAASNAYLWKYAGMLSDMPMGTSDYVYTAYDIPFMAIALSGKMHYYAEYANFQANNKRFLLELVEQGAFPNFLITKEDPIELMNSNSNEIFSSQYELYKDMLISYYKELLPLYEKFGSSTIIGHTRQGDMVKVERNNGVLVYLNYSDETNEMDGVEIPGLAYKVVD